jgi:hypothetical protein
VSARDAYRSQKRGGIKPLFTTLICTCAFSALSQANKWLVHNHSTDICPPLHFSPLPVTSLNPLSFPHTHPPLTIPPVASPLLISHHLCHLISHLCCPQIFFPASVSPPPGHCTQSNLLLCQSSYHTLVHVHFLAIPMGIQLSSKWQNAKATTSHMCGADSRLFDPDETIIKVGC